LELLQQIAEVSPVPLVMHGGSGIPFEVVREARGHNLIKINYGSDLRKAFISTFGRAYEQNSNETNVIELSLQSIENVAKTAKFLVETINESFQ
jgi:fructose/tagatose bisphosphate aldolase